MEINGQPAVQHLEDQYGASWQQSPGEKVYFCRRKAIIDEVRTLIDIGMSERAAVDREEGEGVGNGLTLRQFYDLLKAKARRA